MTLDQIRTAARHIHPTTPAILSIFAGRIADTGRDPVPFITTALRVKHSETKVLWASTREVYNVKQAEQLAEKIQARMDAMNGGEHPSDKTEPTAAAPVTRHGTVVNVKANDHLNVRAGAGGNTPLLSILDPGAKVIVTGEAMNGPTKWYSVDIPGDTDGWVAAAYVKIA